ncbi:MAG: pyrimidine 5'-nucleotidase [Alphaproteobacteria bacterium]
MTDGPDSDRLDHIETWVFDLDNTLYPAKCNLFKQVDRRIGAFITDLLGVDAHEARRIQKAYFLSHGTTLRGLMDVHRVDPEAFLTYVHDIDLREVPPSAALEAVLAKIGGRKLVFTNGTAEHAERVLDRLGVSHHFDGIFDIVDADYVPKPYLDAYRALFAHHQVDPRRAAMIEDIAKNLIPAAALGMTTIWVRTDSAWAREGADGDHIHHVVDDLVDWLEALAARRRRG